MTNDTKEDWWHKKSGKTLGPWPELIAEFFEETAQHILIYQPDRFLTLGNTNLHAEIDRKFIDEVSSEREAREQKRVERTEISRSRKRFIHEKIYKNELKRRKKEILGEMQTRPAPDKEREWRLEALGERLHEIEEYSDQIRLLVKHLKSVFSEAIEEGGHNRASEVDGQLHEAMLEKEEISEKLYALRSAYERELKS